MTDETPTIQMTGTPVSEMYEMVASWVRNGADAKWRQKVAATRAARTALNPPTEG